MRTLACCLAASLCCVAQQPPPVDLPRNPALRQKAEEWNRKMGRGEGRLQPGDPAPDFELRRQGSAEAVRLSQFRGKPVALVFASYT